MATELAWFRLSDKWKVCDEFKQHFWSQKYGEMTRKERENAMKQISKPCPDPNAYQKSRSFKFTQPLSSSPTHTPSTVVPVSSSSSIGDLAQLVGQFSREEISSFSEKANPYPQQGLARRLSNWLIFSWQRCLTSLKSTAFKRSKCSCSCSFFSCNSTSDHCVAVAIQTGRVKQIVASFPERSLTWVSTSAPKSVAAKVPPHKRSRDEATVSTQIALDDHHFTSETTGDTTVVKRKCAKPSDPPPNAPLVPKHF